MYSFRKVTLGIRLPFSPFGLGGGGSLHWIKSDRILNLITAAMQLIAGKWKTKESRTKIGWLIKNKAYIFVESIVSYM